MAGRALCFLVADRAAQGFLAVYVPGEERVVRPFLEGIAQSPCWDHGTVVARDEEGEWKVLAGGPLATLLAEEDPDVVLLAPLPPSPARGAK